MRKTYSKLKKRIRQIKTIVNKYKKLLTRKKVKKVAQTLVFPTPAPDGNSVILTILKFSDQENYIHNTQNQKNLFDKFETFILYQSQGDKLPKIKFTENELNITEDMRKKLYKERLEKELLIKDKNGKYKLNINYSQEEGEKENAI